MLFYFFLCFLYFNFYLFIYLFIHLFIYLFFFFFADVKGKDKAESGVGCNWKVTDLFKKTRGVYYIIYIYLKYCFV